MEEEERYRKGEIGEREEGKGLEIDIYIFHV